VLGLCPSKTFSPHIRCHIRRLLGPLWCNCNISSFSKNAKVTASVLIHIIRRSLKHPICIYRGVQQIMTMYIILYITLHYIYNNYKAQPSIWNAGLRHWNHFAESSRDLLEYWCMLVQRPRPFALCVFLRCRNLQRISCVSSHTETENHNMSQKS
jgi:hypothetical protein